MDVNVHRLRATAAALLCAVAVSPAPAAGTDGAADPRADAWHAGAITAGALALEGVLAATWKTSACEICRSDRLDVRARDALRWDEPTPAQRASDVLANAAIPALAVADALRAARGWGSAGRDALVVAEAASLSELATEVAKSGLARLRPGRPATPGQGSAAYQSLWSGHTAFAFSVATAQAMQDTLRDDPAAPWAWAVGLSLAAGVGYLRVAGDAHWLTDVLAGAAVGSAFGIGVPLAERRLVRGVTIAPAPGGFALRF